jgi:hypothetical protein
MRATYIIRTSSIRFAAALALAGASFTAVAGNSNVSLSMSGTLASACEVTGTPSINFTLTPLASGSDALADTGSGLAVACSADASPSFYVAGTRSLSSGGGSPTLIPFNLSLTSGASINDIPLTSGTATPLNITQDGTPQTVIIYGRVLVTDSQGKPSTTYTTSLTVNVDY